jgi:hypothetical protein
MKFVPELMIAADLAIEVVLFTLSNEIVGTIVAFVSGTFELLNEVTDPVVEFTQCTLLDGATVPVAFATDPEPFEDVVTDVFVDVFQ